MFHVRVSTIERFRAVLQTDYAFEHELIDSIRAGQDGPAGNWRMAAGEAWHRVLESDDPLPADPDLRPDDMASLTEYQGGVTVGFGEFSFDAEAVSRARLVRGPGLMEVTGRKIYSTEHGPVLVKGTADHVHGRRIRDAKTKFGDPDPRDYELSLQWRFYLDIFDADQFTYDLFEFRDPSDEGFCELKNVVVFSFWRYSNLARELAEWVRAFADWAGRRNLLGDLERARFAGGRP
jgi:hypothetical protein